MDPESGLDAVRSVGINGRKIVAISTRPLRGKVEVDSTGLVVAPGFIDLHSHGQTPENYRYKAMDGVTTALELEVGVSPVGEWYAAREGKALINFGASAGHIPARMAVLKDTGDFLPRDAAMNRLATPEEQKAIAASVQKGLDEGALGLGFGLAYTPAATHEEILDLFYLAAKWKRPVFVHVRYGGVVTSGIFESLQEVIGSPAWSRDLCARVGQYVREEKVLSLMDAIRKSSLMPAQRLESMSPQMRQKGRQSGCADSILVVLPEEIPNNRGSVRTLQGFGTWRG